MNPVEYCGKESYQFTKRLCEVKRVRLEYEEREIEEDAERVDDLIEFLIAKKHPIVQKFWEDGKAMPIDLPGPTENRPEGKA